MKEKNTGKVYEELVQEVFQAILNFENDKIGYKRIEVQRNVILNGKTGCSHQVDVYWAFSLGGIEYKTIIEAKDWKSKVKMEQINSFKTVLEDIPGYPKGVYVSRSGYQSGAVTAAKHHGIKLVVIEPEKPVIRVLIENKVTFYDGVILDIDEEWLEKEKIDQSDLERLSKKTTQESAVLLSYTNKEVRLSELMCQDAIPYYYEEDNVCHIIEKSLEGTWFWLTGDKKIPRIKITSYTFQCHNNSAKFRLELGIPLVIINDILEKQKHLYFTETKKITMNAPEIWKI